MADDDFDGGASAGLDDDFGLPKATVNKMIQEMMPSDIGCAKETKDLIAECCVEFIHLLSSEANDICEKQTKKTIAGEHVVAALKSLGFEEYIAEVQEVFDDHSKQLKEREKKTTLQQKHGMTTEELIAMQEELFKKSAAAAAQTSSNII